MSKVEVRKTVTTHDVARHAGVAQMTVSRVLNGGSVNANTRASVLRAIEELGYRPNMAARSMKNRKSRQVGVLLENRPERRYTHPLTWEFVLGINEGLEGGGHIMSLLRLTDVAKDGGLQASALQNQLLDGLIVVSYMPDQIVSEIENLSPKCIWLDANVWREQYCIRRDEVHAGQLAAQALLDLGYRRLACLLRGVSGPNAPKHFSFYDRMMGIRQAVEKCPGATLEDIEFIDDNLPKWQQDIGYIAPDTYLVQRLLLELNLKGVQLGRDCNIVCCDDHFHDAAYHWEPISRISFDRFDMGRQAAEMMLQILHSPEDRCASRLIRGELQAGATAQPFPRSQPMAEK
jgi:DNA-binding LacI/PurR family transcriptional regulator